MSPVTRRGSRSMASGLRRHSISWVSPSSRVTSRSAGSYPIRWTWSLQVPGSGAASRNRPSLSESVETTVSPSPSTRRTTAWGTGVPSVASRILPSTAWAGAEGGPGTRSALWPKPEPWA